MNPDDLTKILLDKMESVITRGNETSDAVNKLLGKLEYKEIQCSQNLASLARCHQRVDDMEKTVNEMTGAKMVVAWVITTAIALWGVFKDHVR